MPPTTPHFIPQTKYVCRMVNLEPRDYRIVRRPPSGPILATLPLTQLQHASPFLMVEFL